VGGGFFPAADGGREGRTKKEKEGMVVQMGQFLGNQEDPEEAE